jgi:hypothetical protein
MGLSATSAACGTILGIEAVNGQSDGGADAADGATDGPAIDATGDATLDAEAGRDAEAGGSALDVITDADGGSADGRDEAEACPPTATASDFYVDHAIDAGACDTFQTIAAALKAAEASSASRRTIHLAQGSYSAATGESFPIELRGGVSVIGAGQGESTITGDGPVAVLPPKNWLGSLSYASAITATFLVGDADASTTISNLSIEGGGGAGLEGIVCDRGNAASPPPPPNTIIDSVTIKGFEASIRVTGSSTPVLSGCNALIRSSTLRDGSFGVVADGLTTSAGDGSPLQVVSFQLGDSASDGNMLLGFNYVNPNEGINHGGSGLAIEDAVVGALVRGNTFAADTGVTGDVGIWVTQQIYDTIGLDIEDNSFGPLSNNGILLGGNVAVSQLARNTFQGISMASLNPSCCGWNGTALLFGFWNEPGMPFITSARNNSFVGNDVGVYFRSNQSSLPTGPSQRTDFGTASSPGGNSFRCNALPAAESGAGADIVVDIESARQPIVVPFEGNVWDHNPPTTFISQTVSGYANGTDVFEWGDDGGADGSLQPLGAAIDVSNGSTVTTLCPSGTVTGP